MLDDGGYINNKNIETLLYVGGEGFWKIIAFRMQEIMLRAIRFGICDDYISSSLMPINLDLWSNRDVFQQVYNVFSSLPSYIHPKIPDFHAE